MGSRGWLRPVGSLPAGVYWRRRLVVGAAVLVVLLIGKAMIGGGGSAPARTATTAAATKHATTSVHGDRAPARAAPRVRAAPIASVSPSRPRKHLTSTTPSPIAPSGATTGSPSATASASPGLPPACRASDVTLTASTDADNYSGGQRPRLVFAVADTADHACRVDLGTAVRSLVVYSGSDRIWSSGDCVRGDHAVVTLRPKHQVSYATVWSLTRSSAACPSSPAAVLPGTYHVVAQLGGVTSPPAVFSLH
jgi:hypothetical protein